MIRAPAALLLGQHPVGIDVTLEPVEEGSARVLRHPPAIITRMHGMGRHARTQTPFLARQPPTLSTTPVIRHPTIGRRTATSAIQIVPTHTSTSAPTSASTEADAGTDNEHRSMARLLRQRSQTYAPRAYRWPGPARSLP